MEETISRVKWCIVPETVKYIVFLWVDSAPAVSLLCAIKALQYGSLPTPLQFPSSLVQWSLHAEVRTKSSLATANGHLQCRVSVQAVASSPCNLQAMALEGHQPWAAGWQFTGAHQFSHTDLVNWKACNSCVLTDFVGSFNIIFITFILGSPSSLQHSNGSCQEQTNMNTAQSQQHFLIFLQTHKYTWLCVFGF